MPEQVPLVPKLELRPKLQLRDTHEQEAPASGGKEAGASTTGVSKPELGNEEHVSSRLQVHLTA